MKQTIQIEKWSLVIDNNEPRARDIDLAERLGYERPRKIRDLVKTYLASGDLSHDDVRPVVVRTRVGIAERNVTEFWLSEAAALFIIAKSETAMAKTLLKEMIRVFMLARRGLLALNVEHETLLRTMAKELAEVKSELSRVALDHGMIGVDGAKRISEMILELAQWQFMRGAAPSTKSAQTRIRQKLCRDAEWGGAGRDWKFLPSHKYGVVLAIIKSMRNDMLAEAKQRAKIETSSNVVQMVLPGLAKRA